MGLISGGGGGGGFTPVGCALDLSGPGVDIHALGVHTVAFDTIWDDIYNQNVLGALPSGIGLSGTFDGAHPNLTTTTAGVWAFSFNGLCGTADAAVRGQLLTGSGGFSQPFGPIAVANSNLGTVTEIIGLPSGAVLAWAFNTLAVATNNPLIAQASMSVVRLS